MYSYSINIDLCTSNYHIQVIDIRSYNKDSYCTTSHSQATLAVGVRLVPPSKLSITQPNISTYHWYNFGTYQKSEFQTCETT